VKQLPHRLRLQLPPQIAGRDADGVERRLDVQYPMAFLDLDVLLVRAREYFD
jgi:hypothetical protein